MKQLYLDEKESRSARFSGSEATALLYIDNGNQGYA